MTIDTTILSILYPPRQAAQLANNLQARPTPIKPVVTLSDVDSKSITRYFIRGSDNCSEVLEIDNAQYTALRTNPRYMVTSVNWKIVGKPYSTTTSYGAIDLGVEEYNKKQVQRADKTFGCLTEYIRDYLELWYANDDGTRTFVRVGGVLNPPFPNYMTSGSSIRNYVNIPMVTRTPTPTFTPTGTPAPSVTPSLSVTPSVTFTPTPSVTFTPTPSVTFTPTPTPTPSSVPPVEQLQFIDAYKAVAQYNLNEYGPYEYTSGVSSRWVVRDFNLVNINNNLQSDVVRTTFDVNHSAIETTAFMYKYSAPATNVGGLALFVPTSSIGTYDNRDYLRGQFVSTGNTMQIVYVSSSGTEVTLASSAVAGWSLSSGTNITMEVRNNTASLYSGSVKIVSASLPSQLMGITNRRVGYFNSTTNAAGGLAFGEFQISTDVPFGTPSYIPIVSGTVMYLDASSSLSYTSGSSTWADLTKFGNSGSISADVGYSSANSGSLMFRRTGSSVVTLNTEYSIKPELPLTIMGWVKSATGSTAMGIIANEAATANYRGAWLSISSSNAVTINYGSGGTQTPASRRSAVTANASFPSQSWTHIAAVIRGATDMSIYINNVSQSLTYSGTGGTISYSTTAGAIGWNGVANEYFSGSIAQMGIHARELLSSEIQSHYNSTQNRFTP